MSVCIESTIVRNLCRNLVAGGFEETDVLVTRHFHSIRLTPLFLVLLLSFVTL
jgi:hypothetical protein